MRIVNNVIYIKQGETPTYEAIIKNRDGSPFVLTDVTVPGVETDDAKFIVEFVVKPSSYTRNTDVNFRHYIDVSDKQIFDGTELKDYNLEFNVSETDAQDWDTAKHPTDPSIYLYRRTYKSSNGVKEHFYGYYKNNAWHDYEFTFNTIFQYPETAVMEAKKYCYEITLLFGNYNTETNNFNVGTEGDYKDLPLIYYKKPLLELTDFVVEGSISG